MQTQSPAVEKVQLKDATRAKIRNSSTKRGYVLVLQFGRRPRGGKVRPCYEFTGLTRGSADRHAEAIQGRFRDFITSRTVLTVDHLGNVLSSEAI